jgi:2',3'-cyclic-nucleotide 2'-phosphodiesterase (5'-nucleotidase family)
MLRIYFNKYLFLLFSSVFFIGCKTIFPSKESSSIIKINKNSSLDSATITYYKPYKDSLDKIMKIQLVELENDLVKMQPESSLGNFLVDILKLKTAEYTKDNIDVAVLNYGGIRIPSLTKGFLNIEHAYLLMPFDNYIVVQELSGKKITELCDSIAKKNGWPIAGITFQIKEKKAINILINNQPLNYEKTYTVALNDYVANGGDDMAFLKKIPQKQTGKLFRDAILEYWQQQGIQHKKITAKLENRISYAE